MYIYTQSIYIIYTIYIIGLTHRQLFINLSNELLQKHFNEFFFRMELEVGCWGLEGIPTGSIVVPFRDCLIGS